MNLRGKCLRFDADVDVPVAHAVNLFRVVSQRLAKQRPNTYPIIVIKGVLKERLLLGRARVVNIPRKAMSGEDN